MSQEKKKIMKKKTNDVPKPKFSGGNIKSLKLGLNINPLAMRPGSQPQIKRGRDQAEAPAPTVTKSRARGQKGRRPPSRKGRRTAQVTEPVEPNKLTNDKTPSSDENVQKPVEKTSPVAEAQPPKAENLFDDDDTFENSTNKKPALFSDDDIFGDNDEDIFASSSSQKKVERPQKN